MPAPNRRRPADRDDPAELGYWHASRRPLQILVFLLPLIIAYELCLALVLSLDVQAHKGLLEFFAAAGIARTGGLYLGGLVIVVILVAWHVLVRERWRVDPMTVAGMAVESIILAVPLLVLSRLISIRLAVATATTVTTATTTSFADLDLWSQMAISVGAGLYEELMFRMVLIAVLHTLLVDVGRVSNRTGMVISILVSAIAFTWYHDLRGADGALSVSRLGFYFLAGIYFGAVFMLRGFGLVVGAHAVYDVLTVLQAAAGGTDA